MPRYRMHRIKDAPRENFRWAPHTGGLAVVKIKDYDVAGELEAATPYAAWKSLAEAAEPLHPGDLLEELGSDGAPLKLLIAKYIGFEPAQWFVPEPKPEAAVAHHPPDSSSVREESHS
jgi:hypothetical protein